MIDIQLDEKQIERRFLEELRKRLDRIEQRKTLWDFDELCRQTCMCKNTIKEKFFFDPRFEKHKLAGKWYFPAEKTEQFLLEWISEQPTH